MVFFNSLNFFAIFLEFSITRREGTERNGTTIFIFSHSLPFPINFGLKRSPNGIFKFFQFFAIFLEFSISRRAGTERNGTTIFIFSLSLPFPINFGLKRSPNGIFKFFQFFAIFLEFSISCRAGMKQNVNFFFNFFNFVAIFFGIFYYTLGRNGAERQSLLSLFLCLTQSILAWKDAITVFLNFLNFLLFFGIFYFASGRNETERQFLFSFFLCLFQPILAWNEAVMIFFNFFNFFAISLEFSITRRVGTDRNGTTIFIFSLSQPFLTYFGLKWGRNDIF